MKSKFLKLRTYQLGSDRKKGEGLRIGTVRRPPRGVPKELFAVDDYYDVWLPILAPSQKLLSWGKSRDIHASWATFENRYLNEMTQNTDSLNTIRLLAELAKKTPIAIGCHCADETWCHRSILFRLIEAAAQ